MDTKMDSGALLQLIEPDSRICCYSCSECLQYIEDDTNDQFYPSLLIKGILYAGFSYFVVSMCIVAYLLAQNNYVANFITGLLIQSIVAYFVLVLLCLTIYFVRRKDMYKRQIKYITLAYVLAYGHYFVTLLFGYIACKIFAFSYNDLWIDVPMIGYATFITLVAIVISLYCIVKIVKYMCSGPASI